MDIVICVCGPTGAMLAALLFRYSIQAVLEREQHVNTDPRGLLPRVVVKPRPTYLGHDLCAGHEVYADLGLDLGGRGLGDVEVLKMGHPQKSAMMCRLKFRQNSR